MIKIDPRSWPIMAEKKLYLDYLFGTGTAANFFTHGPLDFTSSFKSRRQHTYLRHKISRLLTEYNAKLGANPLAMENTAALESPATFCVIGGQQAGFLGGPIYTFYKIITTIRLAQHLQQTLGSRVVPVFWLASEDHDFDEINHTYFSKPDGEIGEIKFAWEQAGRPIADLPITPDMKHAYAEYFQKIPVTPNTPQVKEQFAPHAGENYCAWQARIWSGLFSAHGLVIVEPRTLRHAAADFFQFALEHADDIEHRLGAVAQRLKSAGYIPSLDAERAGRLYTFDVSGNRVRVKEPGACLAREVFFPEHYSTDVALRPLFADAMLPTVASVLGPGEIAYQSMLKPLYNLFDLPQPLLYPRKSYTIVAKSQAKRMADYKTSVTAILTKNSTSASVFRRLMPESAGEDIFTETRQKLEAAFAPLRPYVEEIDPNLGKAWKYGFSNTLRGIDNLEQGAVKAKMSQLGFSRGELRQLSNALLPRDRLQERVFPLPSFLNRYGMKFLNAFFTAGDIDDFSHHILILEEEHDGN